MTGVPCLQVHQSFQTSMPFYGHATSQSDELFLDGWYFSHFEDGGIYTYGLYIHYNIILYIANIIWPHITCWAPCPRGTPGTGALSMRKSEENPGHREFPEGDPIQCHLERRGTWPQETPATYLGPVVSCKISLSLHLDERHQDFTRTSLFRWWLAALVSGEYPPKMTKHFKCVCGHNSARSNPDFFDTHQSDGKKHG